MPYTLTVCDEVSPGTRQPAVTLHLPEPTITARELIRARVFEEARAYNAGLCEQASVLVPPAPEERDLGFDRPAREKERRARRLDWHRQAEVALEAFERNGFLLLVDDRQVESLTEEIRIRAETQVVFLKLVPLMGG